MSGLKAFIIRCVLEAYFWLFCKGKSPGKALWELLAGAFIKSFYRPIFFAMPEGTAPLFTTTSRVFSKK